MAPKTRQARHCQSISKNRFLKKEDLVVQPYPKFDKNLMATSGLLTGKGFCGMKKQANLLNIPTPSKRTYYLAQQKMGEQIVDIVKADCQKYTSNIQDNAKLTTDGRWNHPRNGSSATVTFFDDKQGKIVSFETMSKTKGIFAGNYKGSSGNMETFGVKKALDTLEPSIRGKKVEITHDHDNKTHGVLKRMKNNDVTESLDPGHAIHEVRRNANKHFEKYSIDLKDKKNPKRNTYVKCFEIFEALIGKIIVWFKFLIFNVKQKDQKENMWLNMSEHVIGNHKHCIHPDNLKGLKKTGRPKKKIKGKFNFGHGMKQLMIQV